MNVLVTGGAGYIGSTTAARLIEAGHNVVVYDSLVKGHRASVPAGAVFVQADVADADALARVFSEHHIDAVVHFAAFIEAGESMQNPALYYQNNLANGLNLLRTMQANNVGRIVFSSTAAVYASQSDPLAEDAPLGPANVYGETKLAIERMLHWFNQIHGLRYCALRYFNACGAMLDGNGGALRGEAHNPETHLIPLTLQAALGQRESLSLFGTDYDTPDGTCIRDYVHVEDLATAHVLALEALTERATMTYNLGTGHGHSNREVIQTAREVSGQDIAVIQTDRRPGDSPILVASADKIKKELGWTLAYPDLKDMIGSAWTWHRTHPHGYQKDT